MDQEIRPESRQDSDELDFDDSQEEFYIQSTDYINDVKFNLPKNLHLNCRNNETSFRNDRLFSKRIVVKDEFIRWENFSKIICETDEQNDQETGSFSEEYFKKVPLFDDPFDLSIAEKDEAAEINFKDLSKRSFYTQTNIVSFSDSYSILPFNPVGATGLRGRGVLEKWGPNHQLDIVITRWKKNRDGFLFLHTSDMKPVLEAIVYKINNPDLNSLYKGIGYTIPSVKYNFGKDSMYNLAYRRFQDALNESYDRSKLDLEYFFKLGKRIYYGYIDDPRNTDNAWIESQVYNFHDKEDLLDNLNIYTDLKSNEKFLWQPIDSENDYYMGTYEIMRQVAKHHRAHF